MILTILSKGGRSSLATPPAFIEISHIDRVAQEADELGRHRLADEIHLSCASRLYAWMTLFAISKPTVKIVRTDASQILDAAVAYRGGRRVPSNGSPETFGIGSIGFGCAETPGSACVVKV